MKQEGDLRSVCEKCNDWKTKVCLGCFVGFGGRENYKVEGIEIGGKWDRMCSTICRDEDIAVGRLKPITEVDHWDYVQYKGEENEREGTASDKGSDSGSK